MEHKKRTRALSILLSLVLLLGLLPGMSMTAFAEELCPECGSTEIEIDGDEWYCYNCYSFFDTPAQGSGAANVCPNCGSNNLDTEDDQWYCYNCETYFDPTAQGGGHTHDWQYEFTGSDTIIANCSTDTCPDNYNYTEISQTIEPPLQPGLRWQP